MHKFSTFAHVFINSLFNPQYYTKLAQVKAWFSWQYFLFLNFLLSFVVLAYVLPAVTQFQIGPVADQVVETFPEGVVISGDTTGLHINQELPYSIPFPEFMNEALNEEVPEGMNAEINGVPYEEAVEFNLITFSTDEAVQSVQDFYDSKSIIVVTDTTIYALDDAETGEVRIYAMPAFEEAFSVSQSDLKYWADKVVNHSFFVQKWYVPLLGFLSVLVLLPLSIWLRTIAIAFYTLFIWLIVTLFMKSKKFGYTRLFQIGLHSLTLPLLIKIVVDYFMLFDFSGFWFMLAYVIWTTFLISRIEEQTTSTSKPQPIKQHSSKQSSSKVIGTKITTSKSKVTKK